MDNNERIAILETKVTSVSDELKEIRVKITDIWDYVMQSKGVILASIFLVEFVSKIAADYFHK